MYKNTLMVISADCLKLQPPPTTPLHFSLWCSGGLFGATMHTIPMMVAARRRESRTWWISETAQRAAALTLAGSTAAALGLYGFVALARSWAAFWF